MKATDGTEIMLIFFGVDSRYENGMVHNMPLHCLPAIGGGKKLPEATLMTLSLHVLGLLSLLLLLWPSD